MSSWENSRLTAVVFPIELSFGQSGVRKVGVDVGEFMGYVAVGFVDVTVNAQPSTAHPTVLVLHRTQFATATGLRRCAKWDWALDASASSLHFASTGAVVVACFSMFSSAIWASYFLCGLGQA